MKRCLRLSHASPAATKLVDHLHCETCARLARPRTPRPSKILPLGLQCSEVAQLDLFHLHDASGQRRWFIAVLDVATSYCIAKPMQAHDVEAIVDAWQHCWLGWAGSPDIVICDKERGLVSSVVVDALARPGTVLWPTASYAPWQKRED